MANTSTMKLIGKIEDLTLHLGAVPTIINMLIDLYGLDREETTPAEMLDFQMHKYDILKCLYLVSNIVQDADEGIDKALGDAMDELRKEKEG